MNKLDLSILTELPSFQQASDETKKRVLSLLQEANPGVQEQAIKLTKSAAKGDEIRAVLQYLSILNSAVYYTRPCRMTDHSISTPTPEPPDDLSRYRLTSQILEVLAQFPDGICRRGILDELAEVGIDKHEASVRDSLARLRRKNFICWEPRSSAGRKGLYHVYFLMPTKKLYPAGTLQPGSIEKVKELMSKGYSVTEIALRCGLPRETAAEKCAEYTRRRAS